MEEQRYTFNFLNMDQIIKKKKYNQANLFISEATSFYDSNSLIFNSKISVDYNFVFTSNECVLYCSMDSVV